MMKKENLKLFSMAAGFLVAFVLWTLLVCFVDVKAIGPRESSVGLATINAWAHTLTGVHMNLYVVTDWLGLVPVVVGLFFATHGLAQWIKRKRFLDVDYSILVLGGFYVVVAAVYVLFERFVLNYRPVLIDGFLEASYPSSTTILVMCVMPTAAMQFCSRIKNNRWKRCICFAISAFCTFMVVGRFVSGVHWLSDIVGGLLCSAGLVMLYYGVCCLRTNKKR